MENQMRRRGHDADKLQIAQHLTGNKPDKVTSLQNEACSENLNLDLKLDLNRKDEKGLTLLHYATIYNKCNNVKWLINCSTVDINTSNNNGRTALHLASWAGYKTICQTLLSHKNIKIKLHELRNGETALHWAAERGNLQIVQALIDKSKSLGKLEANLNALNHAEQKPHHLAAKYGCFESLKYLDSYTNDCISLKDDMGSTPLHLAADRGHAKCVQLLSTKGYQNEKDSEERTGLHLAARLPNNECFRLLLKAGADICSVDSKGKTPVHVMSAWGQSESLKLVHHKHLLCKPDNKGITPLHSAASWGRDQCVQFLLDAKVEVNPKDEDHRTPLHYAANRSNESCIKILLNKGANGRLVDKDMKTPLHEAVSAGSERCAGLLVSQCGDINRSKKDGQTALHLAASVGWDMVKLLIDNGANVNVKDEKSLTVLHIAAVKGICFPNIFHREDFIAKDGLGRTALHYAAWNGNTDFVRFLMNQMVDRKIDVNVEDNRGMTPLHGAVYQGHYECVEFLVKHSADINARDNKWKSVLHYASTGGSTECIRLLMKQNTDPNCTDRLGQTALHYAASHGQLESVVALLEHRSRRSCDVNIQDKHHDTPLHLSVQNNHYQIVRALVVTGNADLGLFNNKNELAIHIASSDQNKEIFHFLLDKISKRYNGEWMNAFLNDRDTLNTLVQSQPDSAKVVFDGCIKNTPNKKIPDNNKRVTVDFQYIDFTNGVSSRDRCNHVMYTLANYKHKELLIHPLVLLWLKKKWKVAFIFYFFFLMYFLCFVGLFTAHMIIASNSVFEASNQTIMQENSIQFLSISPYLICTFAGIGLFMELVQASLTKSRYIQWHNCLDWVSYIGSIVVVSCMNDSMVEPFWQWQLGCLMVLLLCINLLFLLQVFPRFGIYVVMVSMILKSFIESFVILFLFIIAFALTFYLLLMNQIVFRSAGHAIMKSMVMMLGELDFSDVFHSYKGSSSPDEILHFESMTYFVFCGFLLMSVIIVNLLTGLAVSDVQNLKKNSQSEMLSLQIAMALDLECALPMPFYKMFYSKPQNGKETISVESRDILQLSLNEWFKHLVLKFFLGPLYEQDIHDKIIKIVDNQKFSNKSLEPNDTPGSALKTHHSKPENRSAEKSRSMSSSDKKSDETCPDSFTESAESAIRAEVKSLGGKVDSLSMEIRDLRSMLRKLLDKR